jgi:hypothetical protein
MARIFISYRREDSGAWAGRLHDRLREHFGRDDIFMDIDTIEPGLDFTEVIERTVASCDVLIALIGRQWLTSTDAAGQRRLDDPEDLVRREIATALRRNIRVIPVLIQDMSMPRAADLPDDLQLLTRRNAVDLSDTHFHRDADQLMVVLDRVLGVTPSPASPAETGPPHVLPPVRSSYLRSWRFWGLAGLIFFACMAFIVARYVPQLKLPSPKPEEHSAPQPHPGERSASSTPEPATQDFKVKPIPSLNAHLTALRFFEGHSCGTLPPERRAYRQRFAKVITRDIFTEITLEYPKREQRLDFTIQAVYQHKTPEDGKIVNRPELKTYLPADSQRSLHVFRTDEGNVCCSLICRHESDPLPLGGWSVGSYIVDVYINGDKVTSGSFEIYE